ncbi:glycosyltransferase [candidate division WOR-3 bacterium]|nr:glycosyltransferase [candidate division WOR-3 bacterium]
MTNPPHPPSTIDPDAISYVEISNPAVMNKDPLVSVHMLTYNHEPYIAQAIEGVLMQETDFPFELVIGEDCSTDRTREIVLAFQKKHPETVRVITSERNVGPSANELRTDKACRGKYLAYCEGDDYWHHPLKLQKQTDYLEAHPEAGMVHSGADIYHVETGRRLRWRPESAPGGEQDDVFTRMLTFKYRHPSVCTVCIRRDLYRSIRAGNPDNYRDEFLMTDTQTILEAARAAGVGFLSESLATHNVLPESLAHSRDVGRRIRFVESEYKLALHLARKHGCSAEVLDRIHATRSRQLLELAFKAGDVALASRASRRLQEVNGSLTLQQKLYLRGAAKRERSRPLETAIRACSILSSVVFRK